MQPHPQALNQLPQAPPARFCNDCKVSTLQQICKVFQNTTQHPCHVLKASLLFTENSHPVGNRVQGLLRSMQHGEAKWFNTKIATVSQCQFSFSLKNQEEHLINMS